MAKMRINWTSPMNPGRWVVSNSQLSMLRCLSICTLLFSFWLTPKAAAQVGGESLLDSASVTRAAQEIEATIRNAITASGGNAEAQRIHIVFGFSTGHFGVEPLRAQAARQTAIEVVDNFLIQGDQVSVYAFEMALWEQPGADRNPLTIPVDHGDAKLAFRDSLPLTPQAGTLGGHDTELAITQIASAVDLAAGPIIVLFLNRAASITTDLQERPLIGENDSRYQQLLETWRRIEMANRSGASYEATYDITRADGSMTTNSLDVVIVVPRAFNSASISQGTRAERLQAPPEAQPEPPSPPNPLPLLIILLLLGLAGLAYYLFFRRGAMPNTLAIGAKEMTLQGIKNGEEIGYLVSRDYPLEDRSPKAIEVPYTNLPTERLASFIYKNGRVEVKSEAMQLNTVNGVTIRPPYFLAPNQELDLGFTGEIRTKQGMPPRAVNLELNVRLGRGSQA